MHTGILYSQHILHDPTCDMNEEGFFIQQYIPVSPQNLLMYLTYNCQDSLYNTVKHCLRESNPAYEVYNATDVNEIPEQEQQQGPPMKKRRKTICESCKSHFKGYIQISWTRHHNTIKLCKPKAYPLHKILREVGNGRCYKVETTY